MTPNDSTEESSRTLTQSSDDALSEHGVRVLLELSQALALAESDEHIFEIAVEGLIKALRADRAAILTCDREGVMRFRAFRGLSDAYRKSVEGHSPWTAEDRSAQPILIEDASQADLGELSEVVAREGIGSLAFIPLISGRELIGKSMVYFDRPHRFQASEIELAQAVSGHVSYAAERRTSDVARNRLAAIVESSYDAIVSKDLNSIVTSWNLAAERLFGWSASEAIGRPITLIIPEDRLDEEVRIIADVRAGRRVEHYETVRVRKDGRQIDVSITVSPVRDSEGRIIGASKIARDISSQKRAEEVLRTSREQLRVVTDAMSAPVVRFGRDLRCLWASREYALWLQWPLEDLEGKHIEEVLGKTAVERLMPYIERALKGESIQYEEQIELRGIGKRWVSGTYTPTRDEAGEIDGWVGVVIDVTERKESERRKDEFLATLAHELRNPLAPIRNAAFLLRSQEAMTPELETIGGILDRQIDQMIRLVDDLMDVSRITRGRISLRRELIDMADVLRSAIEAIEPLIIESGHKLTLSMPGVPVRFYGDPVRLAQIVANILNNACKYTEPGGEIGLTLSLSNGDAVITVKDNGIGIDPEQLPHIFEMFAQQAPAISRSHGGLGIGLSLVKGLVALHGGTVEARSEGIGKGSEFCVRLPLRSTAAYSAAQGAPRRAAKPKGHGLRILVVDDNLDHAKSLGMYLEQEGHTVARAYDGPAAVQIAAEFKPAVAVLDIGLPHMNGYEVARQLRGMPEGEAMLLIALTGWGQDQDRRDAMEAGFDLHMTKPVDVEQLDREIGRVWAPSNGKRAIS